ncbi:MAG: hypothetical protein ACREFO_02000, partial [Acetobacteraceae bacterium]
GPSGSGRSPGPGFSANWSGVGLPALSHPARRHYLTARARPAVDPPPVIALQGGMGLPALSHLALCICFIA